MSNAPTHSVHSAIATGPLLLLLFLLFGCLAPGVAFAIDGYDQLGFRTISDDCGPFFIGSGRLDCLLHEPGTPRAHQAGRPMAQL